MKLTKEQIDQLFEFTKKHLVEHYDVQVELVDHLANAIEDQWKKNPNILFEDALQTEFKKFGVFGFTGLVEQKQAALQKHYWKLIKNELINYFSIPKVILTVALFYMFFQFFSRSSQWLVANDYILLIGVIVITLAVFIYQNIKLKTYKKWLIHSTAMYLYSLPIMLQVYFRFGFTITIQNPSLLQIVFKAASCTLYVMFLLILYFKMIPLLKKEIIQTEKKYQTT